MTRNPMPKQTFRAWLKRQPADQPIGLSRSSQKCPLAIACNSTGHPNTIVGNHISYTFDEPRPNHPTNWSTCDLLPWQRDFIDTIDKEPGQHPITREAALEILEAV